MNENLMTERIDESANDVSESESRTLENGTNESKNSQNTELANLENQSVETKDNHGLSQKVPSELDAEKGIALLVGGTDAEIMEYFGGQGVLLEEILKERNALLNHVKDITYADDLNELQNEFSFVTAKKIQEIPNYEKFAKLRASGLSAIESFEGASGKLISMEYLKNRDEFSYSHLKSTGLKGSVSGDIPIPKEEVAIWKSAFPNDSFTQLTKRYNKTKFN